MLPDSGENLASGGTDETSQDEVRHVVLGFILIGIVAGSISAVASLVMGAGFLAALLTYSGVGAGSILILAIVTFMMSILRNATSGNGKHAMIGGASQNVAAARR